MMKRRKFLLNTTMATAAMGMPLKNWGSTTMKRAFKLCLNPGAIGVSLDQKALLQAAIQYNYEAITPMAKEMLQWSPDDRKAFKDELKSNDISWGSAGLPVEFRKGKEAFEAGLQNLRKQGPVLQEMGVTRMNTWIMPTHATLPYMANMKLHVDRLKACAEILTDFNIKLGLEYVGPKTLMVRDRYPFIHTMSECLEMIDQIDSPTVGIVLDTFHWYCGEDTEADIRQLDPSQIVTVDLNDAVAGRTRDQQLDWERELPGATGVIDIEAFLNALIDIGYDGPVRSEPFNKALNEMEDQQAIQVNREALGKVIGE